MAPVAAGTERSDRAAGGRTSYLDALPKTESRPRRRARWEQSEPTTEGGQMDKEKKAETKSAMADSLADFVIRTARDKDAPPEAVRSLPEAAKVALDLLDYC